MSHESGSHDAHSHDAKLVYMANQIGKFFANKPADKAVEGITDHILKYWDPRMRRAIAAHLDAHGTDGLDPLALQAVEKVREHDKLKAAATAAASGH